MISMSNKIHTYLPTYHAHFGAPVFFLCQAALEGYYNILLDNLLKPPDSSARSRSLETATTSGRAWPTVRPTTTRYISSSSTVTSPSTHHPCSPAVWKPVSSVQPSHTDRCVHCPQQGDSIHFIRIFSSPHIIYTFHTSPMHGCII